MKTVLGQPCLEDGSPQMDWLQKDLAGVDRSVTPWLVAVFHQPYMNSNDAHSMDTEGAPMQQAIEEVLNTYKVDLVFSGHVHAYERSCPAYHYACKDGAPIYITIGDGGNAEGLAATWVEPQPAWSLYRQASYGFGELRVLNATSMTWKWHQNQDLQNTIADQHTFTKDAYSTVAPSNGKQMLRTASITTASATTTVYPKPVTGVPVFAESDRGKKAAAFNALQSKVPRK